MKVQILDTVGTVKTKIQDKEDIPTVQQILIFDGILLKDDFTLLHYNIERYSTLQLDLQGRLQDFKIIVKWFPENIILLSVNISETIENIKAKIQNKEGFPIDHQILFCNGIQLENQHTLLDYDIHNDSPIHLVLGSDNMRLLIKMISGKITTLQVQGSDTIKQIKAKILVKECIPPSEQSLLFAGKQLEDRYALSDYNIYTGCSLHLIVQSCTILNTMNLGHSMKLFIKKLTGQTITLEVEPSDTIKHIKDKIQEKEDIIKYGST